MFPNSPNSSLRLLAVENVPDGLGAARPTVVCSRSLVGSVRSITNSEYQTAAATGVRSELKAVLQCFLYQKEKFALLDGRLYKVDRTYESGQYIELYLSSSDLHLEGLEDAA